MLRYLLNRLAGIIRMVMRTFGRLLKGVSGLLIVALFSLNLAMLAVPVVYNFLSGIMWTAMSAISEGYAARNATAATPKAELDADANQRRQLEVERDRLRAEKMEVESRLGRTETELAEVRMREQKATQDMMEARRQGSIDFERAQRAEAELSRTAAETRQSRRVAGETLSRMQQRSLRMVSRNTAAVFTDALPLIGTVTIVGGIAWDVWDTCAQLDDLRLIGDSLGLPSGEEHEVEQKWCGLSKGEIFALLFQAPPTEEFLCVQARLQTGSLDPLECVDFPINMVDFADPLDQKDDHNLNLPTMDYD